MEITEDNFNEVFKPQINQFERAKQPDSVADEDVCCFNGCMFETYGEDLDYVWQAAQDNPKKVWTIIEGDEGMYYASGFHRVNRMGFLICEVEFDEEMDVKLEGVEDYE